MEEGPNPNESSNPENILIKKYNDFYKIIKDNIFNNKNSNITINHIGDIVTKILSGTIVIHYSEIPNDLTDEDLKLYFTSKGTLKKVIATKIDVLHQGFRHVEQIGDDDERVRLTTAQLSNAPKRVELIKMVKEIFKLMTNKSASKLIFLIVCNSVTIKVSEILPKYKKFYQYNMSKFDENHCLDISIVKYLRYLINGYIRKNINIKEINQDDVLDRTQITSYDDCIMVNKYTTYDILKQHIEDETGNVCIIYNFDEPDIPITTPTTTDSLQRCKINILGNAIKFDFPIQYNYRCPYCDNSIMAPLYKTISTKHKLKCENVIEKPNQSTGKMVKKECGTLLNPNVEESAVRSAYYYNISYENANGEIVTSGAISFDCYLPGYYECVMYKINRPNKSELFHVIGIRKLKSTPMDIPQQNKDENYLITLQKACDNFIKKQTKMNIYGLVPIKIALLIQKFTQELGERPNSNIQIVGSASTGKSTALKYYGFLLNNHLNKTTNGLSISVPGLRGTKTKITIMDTESKIITKGLLGTFKTIHIDEANENPELVRQLKAFLYEDNYGYDKAESDGITHKRTAHVNISENLDNNHLGQYRGSIKKAYLAESIKIGEADKPTWDDGWDLHLPLQIYKKINPYLKKVIKQKRIEYRNKQIFWIDGYDYALHERFPFYFYIVNDKPNSKLDDVVKENTSNNAISENLELMNALKTESIDKFIKSLTPYNIPLSEDGVAFTECDAIFKEYNFQFDTRTKTFYYTLLKISRIVNKRMHYNKQDFDMVRYFLETTNLKLDIADIKEYKIHGPDFEELGNQKQMYTNQNGEDDYDISVHKG